MVNPMTLEGRRIIVTGASSGIGRATAVLASQLGAELVLVARREAELKATLALTADSSRHTLAVGDLGDLEFLHQLGAECERSDGLVAAAGSSLLVPAGMLSSAALEKALRVNCVAFVELMNAFVRSGRCDRRFSAVAVTSVSSTAGWAGGAGYCAAKGALAAAVRALAVELAPKGARVNAVAPSSIDTPMLAPSLAMDREGFLARIRAEQPLGLGRPEQVASAICFLLSEAAAFITGVELPVDGGFLAR